MPPKIPMLLPGRSRPVGLEGAGMPSKSSAFCTTLTTPQDFPDFPGGLLPCPGRPISGRHLLQKRRDSQKPPPPPKPGPQSLVESQEDEGAVGAEHVGPPPQVEEVPLDEHELQHYIWE